MNAEPLNLGFIELLIDMERIDEAWNRLEKKWQKDELAPKELKRAV